MLGLGTKSPRILTRNFPNSFGDILSDIMFIVYVCEGTDFLYSFQLVQITVSPIVNYYIKWVITAWTDSMSSSVYLI